MQILAVPDRLP
ncbi:hypothetical protein YPPY63_2840, partial [Yersinia pestis PY-63]